MGIKINFADVKPFGTQKLQYTATRLPGRQKRIKYFCRYMPLGAARRLADIVTTSTGTTRYNPGVMDELERLDDLIEHSMKANNYTRSQAIQSVWSRIVDTYRTRFTVVTSYDLFRLWLNDVWDSDKDSP